MFLEKEALDHFRRFDVVLPFAAKSAGEKPSRAKGQNLEFEQYSPYNTGDNLRDIDWKAFARSGKLYVKNYGSDVNAMAHLVLDTSASMDFSQKFLYSRRLIAIFAAVLLAGNNRVRLGFLGETYRDAGLVTLSNLEALLSGAGCAGRADISALPDFRGKNAFLVSDLWYKNFTPAELARKNCNLIHVLTPEEHAFSLSGNLELVDSESAARLAVIPAQIRESYVKKMTDRVESFREAALFARLSYGLFVTDTPYYITLKKYLTHIERFKRGRR